MKATAELGSVVGIQQACKALVVSRASFYRFQRPAVCPPAKRPPPPLALPPERRQAVLDDMRSERFVDQSPPVIHAKLLEEGVYHCSVRTMYRILEAESEVRERRNQLRHPQYAKPELLATGPNEVWTWDITKLKGPAKWSHFYLYVILDIYSRYVVGWMIAGNESAKLAEQLIRETCTNQRIDPDHLTIHSDRGPSMTSKAVALLLSDLGVTKSHSRPYVSDDNPYSEAQFKTLKYRPDFPQRFGCIEDAQAHCRRFFQWYNKEHRHSGIAMLTPESVHYGQAQAILDTRALTLKRAFEENPKRFKGKMPQTEILPEAAWINKPEERKQNDKPRIENASQTQ